jgi:hypothetical protein
VDVERAEANESPSAAAFKSMVVNTGDPTKMVHGACWKNELDLDVVFGYRGGQTIEADVI